MDRIRLPGMALAGAITVFFALACAGETTTDTVTTPAPGTVEPAPTPAPAPADPTPTEPGDETDVGEGKTGKGGKTKRPH